MREHIRSVLVVDDDEALLAAFSGALVRHKFEAYTATEHCNALVLARKHRPEAAFIDLQLGTDNGLELLRDLLHFDPKIRAFLITGYGSVSAATQAMRIGAIDVLTKPCTTDELITCLAPEWKPAMRAVHTPSAERALWEHVQRVLRDCDGNKSEAARRLKKPRSWINRLLSRPAPWV